MPVSIREYPGLRDLTEKQFIQLEHFVRLIGEYNKRINLISRMDTKKIWENHIIPSLAVKDLVEIPIGTSLIDVGSGAGFPAIPIKIIRPDLDMVLSDSIRKKALFLRCITETLSLSKIKILNVRVDQKNDEHNLKNKFQIVTARAVASTRKLLGSFSFLLKPTGYFLLWKGVNDVNDLHLLSRGNNLTSEVYSIGGDYLREFPQLNSLRIFKLTPLEDK